MSANRIHAIAGSLEVATWHERRRAMRALLQNPLLPAVGSLSEDFALVRRHVVWLKEWLMRNPGWPLQLDSDFARLRKTPGNLDDGSRPLGDPQTGTPFSRRRYVLFCLALAALERADRQTTLDIIAKEIVSLVSRDPELSAAGIDFTLSNQDERRDLVVVVRRLLDLNALRRVQGDEQQYVSDRGDVLYQVNRPHLAAILSVKRGPSTVTNDDFKGRLRAITEEPVPATDDGKNRRLRSYLSRRLLDDPVLYYENLNEEEMAYLNSQRSNLIGQIHDATGLTAEIRREGLAMVDEGGDLSDVGLPEEGTEGHLTLLLAEFLATQVRKNGANPIGRATLQIHTADLIRRYGSYWRRDATQVGAEAVLSDQVIDRLECLGLIRRTEDGVVPLPAISRYALEDVTAPPEENEDG